MKIAYFVHDLNDAAVRRRVALFEAANMEVRIAGFQRDDRVPARIGGAPAISLGQTEDGALARRVVSVLKAFLFPSKLKRLARAADVIVARNLEALVLGRRVRHGGQRLVYECLDIHRLLLGGGLPSRLLHRIESWALRGVDMVFVSAPAFRDDYFRNRIGYEGDVLLVENLVPRPDGVMPAVINPPPTPPWVIGWFGMLRCRKSFDMLKTLAAESGGQIEVLIAGRPGTGVFDDFAAKAEAAPGVRFFGGYSAEDLPSLFGQIHFIWAIDYFEEGLNSAWLLPNRLYEGLAHGAVPLALRSVATGAWLRERQVGVLLDDPASELPGMLAGMTDDNYSGLREAIAALPAEAVTMDDAEARRIAHVIAGAA